MADSNDHLHVVPDDANRPDPDASPELDDWARRLRADVRREPISVDFVARAVTAATDAVEPELDSSSSSFSSSPRRRARLRPTQRREELVLGTPSHRPLSKLAVSAAAVALVVGGAIATGFAVTGGDQPVDTLAASDPTVTGLAATHDVIVAQFDGNNRDPDDISAMPMAAMLVDAAGLDDRTHVFYGNSLVRDDVPAQLSAMRAGGAFVTRLGIPAVDYQAGEAAATRQLAAIFSSGQRVLVLEGGPFEATHRALSQTPREMHGNITLVSHSDANETFDDFIANGRADVVRDFPDVEFVRIDNQNGVFTGPGWRWMDSSTNPVVQDARALMRRSVFPDANRLNDASDAGMMWFALFGDQGGTPQDAQSFFEQFPPSYDDGPPVTVPEPMPTTTVVSPPTTTPAPPTTDPAPSTVPRSGELAVERLVVVDAETDTDLGVLTDGGVVTLADANADLSVRAETGAGVRSVRFGLDGDADHRVESVAPFSLFGDDGGDYRAGWRPGPGPVTIQATGFDGAEATGVAGPTIAVTVTFAVAAEPVPTTTVSTTIPTPSTNPPAPTTAPTPAPTTTPATTEPATTEPATTQLPVPDTTVPVTAPTATPPATAAADGGVSVTGFVLIDPITDTVVGPLEEGLRLDDRPWAIRIDTGDEVGSVLIGVNDEPEFRIENFAPFSVTGDWNDDFYTWRPGPGTYTITATPFSERELGGGSGPAEILTIVIED
ncbi:MAG: hypothetical protein AAGF91_07795 [Actinomycetota bacterium]